MAAGVENDITVQRPAGSLTHAPNGWNLRFEMPQRFRTRRAGERIRVRSSPRRPCIPLITCVE